MRRKAFLPVLFVTALPLGAAQAQPVGARPVGAAIATQQQIVAAQTAYLLELYALENGAPATPEVQAELTRRATDYFTNGAQVTGVPTAGPAAAYFSNGAAVTTIPTSVIPDYTFAPPSISTPTISGAVVVDAGATPQGTSPPSPPRLPAEAGAATVPEEARSANGPGVVAPPSPQAQEEAAAPPAATPGGDNAPSPPRATATAMPPPSAMPSTRAASAPPASPAVHAARPPPTTKMSSVVWAMVGGLGVGAALVLLGVGVGAPRPGGRRRRST